MGGKPKVIISVQLSTAKGKKVKKDPRLALVSTYVRDRLRAEIAAGGHGTKTRLATALGISKAHVGNMVSEPPTREVGMGVARAAAVHWGMTYPSLEALACGDPPTAALPDLAAVKDEMMAAMRLELAAILRANPPAPGAPIGALPALTPLDDEPLAYHDRVRRIGASLVPPANDDELAAVLGEAAKGGVSSRSDEDIAAAFADIRVPHAKRVPSKLSPAELSAEIDEMEAPKKRRRR